MKVDFRMGGHKVHHWEWQEKHARYWFYNKEGYVIASVSGCPQPIPEKDLIELFADRKEEQKEDINNSMNNSLEIAEEQNDEKANQETL